MLPTKGSSPKENILVIGSSIIKTLKERKGKGSSLELLIKDTSKVLSVSTDHVILSLDWLYIINAIRHDNEGIYLNGID